MPDAALDRGLDQGAGVGGVVAVIAERVLHRFRHDGRAGEMDDRLDAVVLDQLGDERLVADIADDRQHLRRQRGGKAGREVVEHDDALAGIDQRVHGMAADIACAAGDQHRHGFCPFVWQKPYRARCIEPVIAGRVSPDKWPACLMPGIRSAANLNESSMPDVLFIKTSSLGDVIHHMPALTEARARRPDARFAWVVEEAFAPLVRLHPAVGEVIPVAARSWRRAPWQASTWQEVGEFPARAAGARLRPDHRHAGAVLQIGADRARRARAAAMATIANSIKEVVLPARSMTCAMRWSGTSTRLRETAR